MFEKWLSSKSLTVILLAGWLLSLFYSYLFIPPRVDDGYYLMPALSVFNGYPPGLFIADEFRPIFFISPIQPFFNGIFMSLFSLLGFSPDIYNYRLLNSVLVFFLLLCVTKAYKELNNKDFSLNSSANIFLALIAFTPFATNFYVNRPEILGLLLLIYGFLLSVRINKLSSPSYLSLLVGGFILGLASTIHPNYAFYSVPILIYTSYLIYRKSDLTSKAFFYLFSSSIPLSLLLIWFFYNFPIASDQFLNRASEITPEFKLSIPDGLLNVIQNSFLLIGESFIHKLYNSIFMTPFLFCLILSVYFLVRQKEINIQDIHTKRKLLILILVSFILLLTMVPYPPYYLSISFVLAFVISAFLNNRILLFAKRVNGTRVSFLLSVSLVALVAASPLVPSVSHLLKVQATEGEYYDIKRTSSVVLNAKETETLIITTGQLLPPFIEKINLQLSDINSNHLYWLYPIADVPGKDFRELFDKEMAEVMVLKDQPNTVWGSLKKGLNYSSDGKSVCLSLKGAKDYIKLLEILIEFEDRDNIFFRPKQYFHYSSLDECISSLS